MMLRAEMQKDVIRIYDLCFLNCYNNKTNITYIYLHTHTHTTFFIHILGLIIQKTLYIYKRSSNAEIFSHTYYSHMSFS